MGLQSERGVAVSGAAEWARERGTAVDGTAQLTRGRIEWDCRVDAKKVVVVSGAAK